MKLFLLVTIIHIFWYFLSIQNQENNVWIKGETLCTFQFVTSCVRLVLFDVVGFLSWFLCVLLWFLSFYGMYLVWFCLGFSVVLLAICLLVCRFVCCLLFCFLFCLCVACFAGFCFQLLDTHEYDIVMANSHYIKLGR